MAAATASSASAGGAQKLNPKKLPPWAWVAIVGAGVLAFVFIGGRRNAAGSTSAQPSSSGSGYGGLSPDQVAQLLAANAGGMSSNAAPADNLSPYALAALGVSLEQLGTLGNALAGIAVNADAQLGALAQSSTGAALGVAAASVQANTQLAGNALAAAISSIGSVPVYAGSQTGAGSSQPASSSSTGQSGYTGPTYVPMISHNAELLKQLEAAHSVGGGGFGTGGL